MSIWFNIVVKLFLLEICVQTSELWFPQTHVWEPEHVFSLLDHSILSNKLNELLNRNSEFGNYTNLFQWTSATGISDGQNSWIIFGGSVPRTDLTKPNVHSKQIVGVVGCQISLKPTDEVSFQVKNCEIFKMAYVSGSDEVINSSKNHPGFGMLGSAMTTLLLDPPEQGFLVVYCDPLWTSENVQNETVNPIQPGGQCRIRLNRHGKWSNLANTNMTEDVIHFCSTPSYSKPCGGGFTIDLRQSYSTTSIASNGLNSNRNLNRKTNDLPNIQLLVGLPFAQPYGEVQVVDNILNRFGIRNSNSNTWSEQIRISSRESNFGHKVLWTPALKLNPKKKSKTENGNPQSSMNSWTHENLALISSSSTKAWPSVTAYRPWTTTSGDQIAFELNLDSQAYKGNKYSGFGMAIDTVRVPLFNKGSNNRAQYAIIIGAPYETVPHIGPNTGAVYIGCPEEPSDKVNISKIDQIVGQLSVLNGTEQQIYFGYSIARIGDVDGDGIEDVAIGAPALPVNSSKSTNGRVYILRVTDKCSLDPKPIQVLQAPNPQNGDGFGINIARSFDADQDGWPELLITSLLQNATPYLYTMPRRLTAQCQFDIPPNYAVATFQAGSRIPLTIRVRLFDSHTKQFVKIPEGITSKTQRIHQINPDVLWQRRFQELGNKTHPTNIDYDEHQSADLFFLSITDGHTNLSYPRFDLVNQKFENLFTDPDQSRMTIRTELRALYGAQTMNLLDVPVTVAYRSVINRSECTKFNLKTQSCRKAMHPLIDWSQCQSTLKLAQPLCVPDPQCASDLSVKVISVQTDNHSPIPIEFGNPKAQHQLIQLEVINQGPTKASGVRVEILNKGWQDMKHKFAIRSQIVNVHLRKFQLGEQDASRISTFQSWSVKVADNGVAALISSLPHTWVYKNEGIHINISIFINGLLDSATKDLGEPMEKNYENLKGGIQDLTIQTKVTSGTMDENLRNNVVDVSYQVNYSGRLDINAGLQPPTVIDTRKSPIILEEDKGSRKVFSSEIGPKVGHTFLIENRGWPVLKNLSFILEIPMQTFEGDRLVYLTDHARQRKDNGLSISWMNLLPQFTSANGQTRGSCEVEPQWINPKKFTILDYKHDGILQENSELNANIIRRYIRDTNLNSNRFESAANDSNSSVSTLFHSYSSQSSIKRRTKGRITLACPNQQDHLNQSSLMDDLFLPKQICTRIRCHLVRLDHNDAVRLKWDGWLWAETFFKLHTPDVKLVSRLTLESWGNLPESLRISLESSNKDHSPPPVILNFSPQMPRLELKQSIILRGVPIEKTHQVPWWPIIAGIVVGLLLLSMLSSCLYCCGFFRRQTRHKLEKSKPKGGSSSHDLLLNGDANEHTNGKSNIPPFFEVKSSYNNNGRHFQWQGKNRRSNQPEVIVETSPNLLCVQAPEPPSPQPTRDHSSKPNWIHLYDNELLLDPDESTEEEKTDSVLTAVRNQIAITKEDNDDDLSLNTSNSEHISESVQTIRTANLSQQEFGDGPNSDLSCSKPQDFDHLEAE